jgi:ankyrin repeat protein
MTSTLLNLGANPNVICNGGYTATHAACYVASKQILTLILKFGGDLETFDFQRKIPL